MANRKKESKLKIELAKEVAKLHPMDDVENWLKGDFATSPWRPEEMAAFQKRIDVAFGAENAILLIWSGDRSYGDAFYTDWYPNGLPKGKLERKPVLLFAEEKVNEHDYIYVSCPRFLLVEVNHGSQLEGSWAESMWVECNDSITGRKQIRADHPPKYFYSHLRIIAQHDTPQMTGTLPNCCVRMMSQNRICYGKYRVPSDEDLKFVRKIRENMDKAGVAQRNDEKRSAKVLEDAALSTRHFIQQAQQQKALAVQEIMLENVDQFFGDIPERMGTKLTLNEIREAVKEGFDQQNDERFG